MPLRGIRGWRMPTESASSPSSKSARTPLRRQMLRNGLREGMESSQSFVSSEEACKNMPRSNSTAHYGASGAFTRSQRTSYSPAARFSEPQLWGGQFSIRRNCKKEGTFQSAPRRCLLVLLRPLFRVTIHRLWAPKCCQETRLNTKWQPGTPLKAQQSCHGYFKEGTDCT